jgi:bifunctional DNA-binding transcriptional regulator/antitoxin component of YhaV-PrlF toxin-antitoxin module
MSTRNITITSKNQITLPIEYVRNLHLTRNRVLQIELRGGAIVLTPRPTLGDTMRRFWGKHHAQRPLSDEEIKQAVRTSSVERVAKSL